MGGHSNAPTVQPSYTGLQLQTSTNALPIPIIYGVNIVAPNIIWNGDFIAIAQYSQSSGGKGGGGSPQVTGYTYETAIIMVLCEGPINAIGTIWKGQSTYTLATVNPPASTLLLIMRTDSLKPASMSAFTGTTPQSVWGYLASAHAAQAINYPGLAYLASPAYDLGSSGALDVTNIEVYGVLSSTGISVAKDANPALVIQDFLTNAQYGVGFPAASIDATTLLGASGGSSFQVYCEATGIAISPALTNQETANSILTRWLQLTNTAAVWSGGKLKFIPYGDSSVSLALPEGGVSVTFNSDLTPLYDLTDDDFVASDGEDPVQVTRTDPYAAYNLQPVEILARDNSYAPTPIIAFDQNAIDSYGLRIASTITAHEICEGTIGQVIAQLILQRGLYIRNTYNFKLSWEYCLLEPMDLVTLSDAGLGLSRTSIRIIEIEEDEDGLLSVTAEEFPGGIATAVAYPVQTSSGAGINRNVAPASVNPPLIFEPPAALTSGGEAEVWIGLSGGVNGSSDPNWGGATIWISRDDTSYTAIGMVMSVARQGTLAASLPASAGQSVNVPPFDTIDVTDTLTVNMGESAGELNSAARRMRRMD